MKKLMITLLSLTTLCFAGEGNADKLAGLIFLILFAFIGIPAIIYIIGMPLLALCKLIETLWEKTNTFGKLICLGLPGIALTGTIFYFLIWFAIPSILELVCEWPIVSASITGGLYYISTILTGWKDCDGSGPIKKRYGKYAVFSRIFASLPILPIILVCWLIKNLFGILFIKDYTVSNILGFWKMPVRKTTFNKDDLMESELREYERQRQEFLDKVAKGEL